MVRAHKKLDVWKQALQLTTAVYQVTRSFPKEERYGLSSQMRRAAVSVPSNIAEGAARHSAKEFCNFLNIAGGSLSELDTQIEIARDLGFVTEVEKQFLDRLVGKVSMTLAGLIRRLRADS